MSQKYEEVKYIYLKHINQTLNLFISINVLSHLRIKLCSILPHSSLTKNFWITNIFFCWDSIFFNHYL